jgi:hypothetical protein
MEVCFVKFHLLSLGRNIKKTIFKRRANTVAIAAVRTVFQALCPTSVEARKKT